MMRQLLALGVLIFLAGCAATPRWAATEPCTEELSGATLVAEHWLQQSDIWRLRQSALLEIRGRKIPLEGFMLLDLRRQEIRLVAMNEMGIVLFELLVTPTREQLLRAVPQLQQQGGLAAGIAESLRRIYLVPRPQTGDYQQQRSTDLRLWRVIADQEINFIFDCAGQLRQTLNRSPSSHWQVLYQNYRGVDGRLLPEKIEMNDFQQGVSLILWQREVTVIR